MRTIELLRDVRDALASLIARADRAPTRGKWATGNPPIERASVVWGEGAIYLKDSEGRYWRLTIEQADGRTARHFFKPLDKIPGIQQLRRFEE